MLLAWRLRGARRAAGLTQQDVAERLRLSRPLIAKWELGETLPPVHRLSEVARHLGVDAASLLGPHGSTLPAAGASAAEESLARRAEAAFLRAARDGCEPPTAGAIFAAEQGDDAQPRRGRPVGAARGPMAVTQARGPEVAAPTLVPQTLRPARGPRASPEPAARPAGPHVRERVTLTLLSDDTPEHHHAARDLARYWGLLDTVRTALTAQAPLDDVAARALARALDTLELAHVRSAGDAQAQLRAWATTEATGEDAAWRSYCGRVAQRGAPFALACVDVIERARAFAVTERVGQLLRLLGNEERE
ncbi:helix-turn-helix transcriptional regulator [Roseisolibacter sp. H3M3-2]|uniref:helix-turn-helix domain-containing protein n=1 Tax=Roseisolibacter sp. H3M3-2 TaxID=3031323 RepID=UPI0023DA421D|nr:helix-turn-helix transcriptional regulator [Roseisolibacter sp. H3M3-2]MDF1501312.1 helix-turn-helix transcriptional regulator [Roseisolibacter sp. H3M3-2]